MHNGYYNGASYQPKAPLWTSRTFVLEYCMDIQVLKNEKNDTPATFLFYHISFNCVYSFNHFSSHTNNRHHRTSQRHSKLHAVFSAGKYSVWNIVVCHIRFSKNQHITRFYTNFMILTFRGPCIVIYSYNKSHRDALFLNFILVKNSTCFGQIYRPSSGVLILYSQQ